MQVDVALIGGGFSNAMALRSTVQALVDKSKNPHTALPTQHIAIVDKQGDFSQGVAYGKAADPLYLLNAPVKDMEISEGRNEFKAWVEENAQRWLNAIHERGGLGVQNWLRRNQQALKTHKYDDLYLPRFVFGMFLHDEYAKTLELAASTGVAHITPIHSDVVRYTQTEGGHTFDLNDGQRLTAPIAALGIGGAPGRTFPEAEAHTGYIGNLYAGGSHSLLSTIREQVQHKGKAHIAVLGTNAAFMDLVHLVANHPELHTCVEIIGISSSGEIPRGGTVNPTTYQPLHLRPDIAPLTATAFLNAVETEVARGLSAGYSPLDIRMGTHEIREQLFNQLPNAEKARFTERFGSYYETRVLGITAPESATEAWTLQNQGILSLKKGIVTNVSQPGGALTIHLNDENCPQRMQADIVINCLGSAPLHETTNPLIRSMIESGSVRVNASGKGLWVNDALEAAPGLLVLGPLLTGNITKHGHHHHMDGAGAIGPLAPVVAQGIVSAMEKRYTCVAANDNALLQRTYGLTPPDGQSF